MFKQIQEPAVSYGKKKVLILPLLDALSPLTGGVGGGLTLWATSNKKLLFRSLFPRQDSSSLATKATTTNKLAINLPINSSPVPGTPD